MKRKQIAVCDREQEYTLRFVEYSSRRQESPFVVHGFTSREALLEYVREHPVDIVLLSAELWDACLKKEPLGQLCLLWESEYRTEGTEYPGIYKYQSCRTVLGTLLNLYAEQLPEGMGQALRTEKMKRIGIYSPVGRLGKTRFAMALGKELAKKSRTLYLNLEEYSGFEALYPYGDGWTLSELMYFLKQGKHAFACKLEGMIQQTGGMDYIPPVKSPVEMRHITREDWESLLDTLERESCYEAVVLDLSGAVNGLYEILGRCDGIYTLVGQDETARAKLGQYEMTLKLLEMEDILERTRKVFCVDEEAFEEMVQREAKRWWNHEE